MMDAKSDGDIDDEPGLETVLLAVGGRDETRVNELVEVVETLAAPSDASVIIVHVFDRGSHSETVRSISETGDEHIDPNELAARMTVVHGITDRLRERSITHEVRATTGRKGEGVVEIAENSGADNVVIGGRQRSPTGKAIFGSIVQTVMLNAPCPVTFVRDQK